MAKRMLNVQSFPRPPLLEKLSRHIQIKWKDNVIVDTKDAYWVLETHHPPSLYPNVRIKSCSTTNSPVAYYLPPDSVKVKLKATPRKTFCEVKVPGRHYHSTRPFQSSSAPMLSSCWPLKKLHSTLLTVRSGKGQQRITPSHLPVDRQRQSPTAYGLTTTQPTGLSPSGDISHFTRDHGTVLSTEKRWKPNQETFTAVGSLRRSKASSRVGMATLIPLCRTSSCTLPY